MPYHVTWSHELDHGLGADDAQRMLTVDAPEAIPAAVAELAARAQRL
jgi:putative hydrolase of the HAD superfamily